MKLIEVFETFTERGLSNSQRHFSGVWLERGENYLSQNKDGDLSADDAMTLWRSLQNEGQYELAAKILADLLEDQ